ncbi:MAG TPA: hypothetical protein VGF69_22010 [Thermoanaerobaculia bacterium]|jgi:hypothetical protein
MPIILPYGLTTQELRVLQEFRRMTVESLPVTAIKAIRHPAGGGDAPALALVEKGYLEADAARETFTLTEKAKALLAIDPVPLNEDGSAGGADAELPE